MKTLTYLFWSLKKNYERIWLVEGQYNWTILSFSLPYNLPLLIFSGVFSKEYIKPFLELKFKNGFWETMIVILFPVIIFILLAQPLKLLFPKKSIEKLEYTREEKKQYKLRILYSFLFIIIIIFLIWAYPRYMSK